MIILTMIGKSIVVDQANSIADEWVEKVEVEDPNQAPTIPSSFDATDAEAKRLLEQVKTIRNRALHHFAVMKFFYARYYMAISIAMALGVIAATALLFITRSGWDRVNPYVKTIFITASALTAYFGAFPPVFQQSQNIADNKKLYLQYIALHDEVISYLPLQENINGEQKKVSEFIHYVDRQLVQLNTFAIGFDDTKVPNYKNTFELK